MKKVVVIGLDGFEPKIAEAMIARGELPNLSKLQKQGEYSRLGTTHSAQTPVAWSTFSTGTNPGGHGIFDFLSARREAGDEAAKLALEMYTYRIKKYVGGYTAVLGKVDALVFTAGVGENSTFVRQMACTGLQNLGYHLDPAKNNLGKTGTVTEIQSAASRSKILIIPTNEELEIAQQTMSIL